MLQSTHTQNAPHLSLFRNLCIFIFFSKNTVNYAHTEIDQDGNAQIALKSSFQVPTYVNKNNFATVQQNPNKKN